MPRHPPFDLPSAGPRRRPFSCTTHLSCITFVFPRNITNGSQYIFLTASTTPHGSGADSPMSHGRRKLGRFKTIPWVPLVLSLAKGGGEGNVLTDRHNGNRESAFPFEICPRRSCTLSTRVRARRAVGFSFRIIRSMNALPRCLYEEVFRSRAILIW